MGRGDRESEGAMRLDGIPIPPPARAGGPPPAPAAAASPQAPQKPRDAFLRATPPADRMTRQELVRVADKYFSGMQSTTARGSIRSPTTAIASKWWHQPTNAPGRKASPARSEDGQQLLGHGDLPGAVRIQDCCTSSAAFAIGATWPSTRSAASSSRSDSSITTPARTRTSDAGWPQVDWQVPGAVDVGDRRVRSRSRRDSCTKSRRCLTRAPYGMGSGWSSRADAMSDRIQFEK